MKKFQAITIAAMFLFMLIFSGCIGDSGNKENIIQKIYTYIFVESKPQGGGILPLPPDSIVQPEQKPSNVNLDIYWDATVSMQGFTRLDVGNIYRTLPDTLANMGALLNGQVNFSYFGEQINKLEGRDHLDLRYPEFYTETITSFGRVLEEAKTENLSVVVTDLFESDADWSNITKKLKEKYFNNHLAVAIIGIKNSFNGEIYDVGIDAASFSYDSGDDPNMFRPFYLFLMGSDAQIRVFLDKWKENPYEKIVVFSEHFTNQSGNLRVDKIINSNKNIFGVNKLSKSDNRLQEIGIKNWEENVEFSIPTEFSLYSENCTIKDFQSKVKIFALNEGIWQKQTDEDNIAGYNDNGSKNDNNYNYNLKLSFKPKSTLPLGKIGLIQVQVVISQENIEVPNWINDWNMNDVDISYENFDGTKTVNLKRIAESLKNSMLADTQPKIFELDLVIDGRR